MKPIETVYKGYRFRSRLEARWAVFFDALGWPWEYEKEGFDLGEAGWYLPDFWLPDAKCFVEVKPEEPSAEELAKVKALARGYAVLLVVGLPAPISYRLYFWGSESDKTQEPYEWPCILDWHKGEIGNFEYTWSDPGTDHSGWHDNGYDQAVTTARSARFEHGENKR